MSEIVPLSLSSILRGLVDVGLPAWHPTRAMYVGLDLRVNDEGYEPLGSCSVHLLFHKCSNYLTVWAHVTPRSILPRWGNVKPEDWGEHESHHDSCWLDAARQRVVQAYFAMCNEAAPDTAPIYLNFSHCISSTALLDIEYERRPTERGRMYDGKFITSVCAYKTQDFFKRDGEVVPLGDYK